MNPSLKLLREESSSDDQHARPRPAGGIVVLGMHRAGTSAVTRVFVDFEFEIPGRVAPPGDSNPKGFWESVDFVEIHEEFLRAIGRSWSDPRPLDEELFLGQEAARARESLREAIARSVLPLNQWILKDPRMCRLMPLWQDVLEAGDIDPHFLHVLRSPLSVAASLEQRDRFSEEKSLLLWLRHYLEAERATRGKDRTWLHFEELNARSSAAIVDRVRGVIGASRGSRKRLEKTLDRVLDPTLVHHQHSKDESLERLEAHPWVARAYRAFDSLAAGDGEQARAALDELRFEIFHAGRLLLGHLRSRETEDHGERYYRLSKDIERFHRSVDAQRRELETQRAEVAAMHTAFDAERQRLEAVWQEISEQYRLAESQGAEIARRQVAAEGQRQGISQSLDALAGHEQQLDAVRQKIDEISRRQEAAEGRHQGFAESLDALARQQQHLDLVRQTIGEVARRQAEGQHRVRSQHDHDRQALATIADRTSTIQELISERLEKRHMTLLHKSLGVISELESHMAIAQDRLDEATKEQEEIARSQRRGISESLDMLARQGQQLETLLQATDAVARGQEAADGRHQGVAESLSALTEQRHQLDQLHQSIDRVAGRQEAGQRQRQMIIQAAGGDREVLVSIAEGTATIQELISERLEKHHLAALQEHLQVISRLESHLATTRDRLEDATRERDAVLAERHTTLEERNLAIAERDRWLAERDVAVARLDAAVEERNQALAERDRWLEERDAVAARLDVATEERNLARVECDRWLEEHASTVARLEAAIQDRDLAAAERQQREVTIRLREQALEELEQARQSTQDELDRLLRRKSWKLTAPLRWLYGKWKGTQPGP